MYVPAELESLVFWSAAFEALTRFTDLSNDVSFISRLYFWLLVGEWPLRFEVARESAMLAVVDGSATVAEALDDLPPRSKLTTAGTPRAAWRGGPSRRPFGGPAFTAAGGRTTAGTLPAVWRARRGPFAAPALTADWGSFAPSVSTAGIIVTWALGAVSVSSSAAGSTVANEGTAALLAADFEIGTAVLGLETEGSG